VSIESPFWDALGEIARQRRTSLSRLVTSIDLRREHYNLSSAIRLFVFDCHRRQPATVLLKAPIQRRLIS
jgi:predicted DNA-binding ribbon-helix-helix protein